MIRSDKIHSGTDDLNSKPGGPDSFDLFDSLGNSSRLG